MKRILFFCVFSGLMGAAIGVSLYEQELPTPLGVAQAQQFDSQPAVAPSGNMASARPTQLTPEEKINVFVYEHTNPSVVNIDTRTVEIDQFFMMRHEAEGTGSGVILDKAGHVITNNHVIDGAREISVTLSSSKEFPATLVGADKETDVAVLKINAPAEDLQPVSLGRSDDLRVGQRVYALGNPFDWNGTLTTGIISSLNRNLPSRVPQRFMKSLIQTDAAMNPGNSGGPLLNSNAEMIGMCVAIATRTGQNSGVGFAIPIDRIKQIVPELIQNGRVLRADIGIIDVVETDSGLLVRRLVPDGPAARAGLQGFRQVIQRRQQGPITYESVTVDRSHADRILAIDGEPMRTGVQFIDKIAAYHPGDTIELTIVRDGKELKLPVTLGSD